TTQNLPTMSSNNQNQNQDRDYLDKGLDAAQKKFGGKSGQDTDKNRKLNEKI
ncbi:hypothetical protein CC80DRAFT_383527, partial [Byssothecium circinans]